MLSFWPPFKAESFYNTIIPIFDMVELFGEFITFLRFFSKSLQSFLSCFIFHLSESVSDSKCVFKYILRLLLFMLQN